MYTLRDPFVWCCIIFLLLVCTLVYLSMPVDFDPSLCGGKGNRGKFVDRQPQICAAGVPSSQPEEEVAGALQHFLLQDHAEALIRDAVHPPPPPRPRPPLRKPLPLDKRNAVFGEVAEVVNPPNDSKIQTLIEDLKCTPYKSYWTKQLGRGRDPKPMFPAGYDIEGTTYGLKLPSEGSLYDIVMPKVPLPDKTPRSKWPGVQTDRNYCKPPFNPDLTYGYRTDIDKRGKLVRCCLTDKDIVQGTGTRTVINFVKADYDERTKSVQGAGLEPNENIREVPPGYRFGTRSHHTSVPQCLTTCDLYPDRQFYLQCLAHLNSLRKVMSTRFLPSFYRMAYLNLKYFDCDKSGWLPKNVVYDYCGTKHVRFDPALIEPLLLMWKAFDGERIEYKTFIHVINYKQNLPDLPKVPDMPPQCLDFKTTYREMVKPGQEADKRLMAGLPSGRYFDTDFPVTPENYCKTDRVNLPDETDMKSCLQPSTLTLLSVTHRDMFAKREPAVVRRVFEATGEKFTDEQFNAIWEEAKKYHSQGLVCYETFRKAMCTLEENQDAKNNDSKTE